MVPAKCPDENKSSDELNSRPVIGWFLCAVHFAIISNVLKLRIVIVPFDVPIATKSPDVAIFSISKLKSSRFKHLHSSLNYS